ncbi:MAG: hypothetical protein Q4C68_05580 [Moraxella sp.]|nr:hypothetical protein [Moraxella sp.]
MTTKPKHPASQELWVLTKTLTTTSQEVFANNLSAWHDKNKDYLSKRTINNDGKSWYTHKRLRSAYHSLKRNLPYLFVYLQDQSINNNIPNTTNKLEGLFSHLKQSLRCHQGLNKQRKQQFIESDMIAYMSHTIHPNCDDCIMKNVYYAYNHGGIKSKLKRTKPCTVQKT